MGIAATRTMERVAASLGMLTEATPHLEVVEDVPAGGVLLALPALLAIGLLRHPREHFKLPAGFYGIESIFLIPAFMALARVRSLEQLRYEMPGEWGKLLGLDRIPEVRTLRSKLGILCEKPESIAAWGNQLSGEWMEMDPAAAGTLLIDGHTRVYHGNLTKLPRHYVSRERLCLRATTDYWVNALDGAPFFVVTKTVDPGLIATLREDIVPRLEKAVPNQPHDIEQRQTTLSECKTQRSTTAHKLPIKDLPTELRLEALSPMRKHFIDIIKLIAYRAESALVHVARETLKRTDDARSFIKAVFASSVDLRPDTAHATLSVCFHSMANPTHNKTLSHLCQELTDTATLFPGTSLRMVFWAPSTSADSAPLSAMPFGN